MYERFPSCNKIVRKRTAYAADGQTPQPYDTLEPAFVFTPKLPAVTVAGKGNQAHFQEDLIVLSPADLPSRFAQIESSNRYIYQENKACGAKTNDTAVWSRAEKNSPPIVAHFLLGLRVSTMRVELEISRA